MLCHLSRPVESILAIWEPQKSNFWRKDLGLGACMAVWLYKSLYGCLFEAWLFPCLIVSWNFQEILSRNHYKTKNITIWYPNLSPETLKDMDCAVSGFHCVALSEFAHCRSFLNSNLLWVSLEGLLSVFCNLFHIWMIFDSLRLLILSFWMPVCPPLVWQLAESTDWGYQHLRLTLSLGLETLVLGQGLDRFWRFPKGRNLDLLLEGQYWLMFLNTTYSSVPDWVSHLEIIVEMDVLGENIIKPSRGGTVPTVSCEGLGFCKAPNFQSLPLSQDNSIPAAFDKSATPNLPNNSCPKPLTEDSNPVKVRGAGCLEIVFFS